MRKIVKAKTRIRAGQLVKINDGLAEPIVTEHGSIDAALVRLARLRILSYETALSRRFHPDDPERQRLEQELANERNKLSERYMLKDKFRNA